MRRAFTLLELLIVVVILLLLASVAFVHNGAAAASERDAPSRLLTVEHDDHLFIVLRSGQGGIIHHPDCPCPTPPAADGEQG